MADTLGKVLESPQGAPPADQPDRPPDWFDEEAYLRANPDVAAAMGTGEFRSAFDHYTRYGEREQRPLHVSSKEPRDRLIRTGAEVFQPASLPDFRAGLESVMLSPAGGLFVFGWVDDRVSPVEWLRVSGQGWFLTFSDARLCRLRRPDVETLVAAARLHAYGFFGFVYTAERFDVGGDCQVLVHLRNGQEQWFGVPAQRVSEVELRNSVLNYLAGIDVFGNRQVEAARLLRGSLSAALVRHNRDLSHELVKRAYVERFGPRRAKLRGSIVVCLYGRPEYLFLQSALFAGGPGFEDYEMIYVCNSPELAEQLLKDARTGALVYGLPQTVVVLPGNAGFGAANNLAVNFALSDRLLIVNPDVFPRDPDWARKHTGILAERPEAETKLFGGPLYYDDGSLMHGGMYFEFDTGLSMNETAVSAQRLLRVEHYGKGAPADSTRYTRRRPVPAVTGAFMSLARAWYEKLGGFTEDYVMGHYEDADLCLKSLSAGVVPWIQDVRFWHMEGKGSPRQPIHEGAASINRTIFTERWESLIDEGLEGPHPRHPLLIEPGR